jgi:integrase
MDICDKSRDACGSGECPAGHAPDIKKAQLPLHFTPHCLRHSYASILLAEGVSPVYVQEQLGHATIELTVSTYGRWLKKKAPGALDRLDRVPSLESGSSSGFSN